MKKLYLLLLLCSFGGFVHAQQLFSFPENEKAKKDLMIFYSQNCDWCIKLDKEMESDNNFINELTSQYSIKSVNVSSTDGRATANKFSITGTPHILFSNGTAQMQSIKGFQN